MIAPDLNVLLYALHEESERHAVLALEHNCTYMTTDRHFSRFPGSVGSILSIRASPRKPE
jgi:predicted nucleic acid-binding protein